jgi:hypothetical protein
MRGFIHHYEFALRSCFSFCSRFLHQASVLTPLCLSVQVPKEFSCFTADSPHSLQTTSLVSLLTNRSSVCPASHLKSNKGTTLYLSRRMRYGLALLGLAT